MIAGLVQGLSLREKAAIVLLIPACYAAHAATAVLKPIIGLSLR